MITRTFILIAILFCNFSSAYADEKLHAGRGNPWEYDEGPAKDSELLKILTQTPNFRGIGRAVIGEERFRWHWGPVPGRGRWGKNEVKVLVIGQEGAQDEALSKRAFTGGTGQKLQNFLNSIGINRSYLFLNTFIYSIRGQYRDKELPNADKGDLWLAQHLDSPIVQHRHRLFNHLLENNKETLKLVVAVGTGAKETVVTWIKSRGGNCKNEDRIETCDGSVLAEGIRLLGVKHPGMANQAKDDAERQEILKSLRADFEEAVTKVISWSNDNPSWLLADSGGNRPQLLAKGAFRYRSAPVPYRDFAFGTNWRLGRGSTTSNRTPDQRSIRLFSDLGEYNNKAIKYRTPRGADFEHSGYIPVDGDRPYESPRTDYNAFDPGPGEKWARLLMGGEPGFEWPDFNTLGVKPHKSFGTGPIYRGRLDEATVLILADQESHDDLFTGRALSGDGGQKVQHFLKQIGITSSYVIIRTLPVDTLDLAENEVKRISDNPQVVRLRNEIVKRILDQSKTQVILTFGPRAKNAIDLLIKGHEGIPILNLALLPHEHPKKIHRNYKNVVQSWNEALKKLSQMEYEKDTKANFENRYEERNFKDIRLEINRYDLPFATVRWFGTSGSLAAQALSSPEYYQMTMPEWAARTPPPPLSKEEKEAVAIWGK